MSTSVTGDSETQRHNQQIHCPENVGPLTQRYGKDFAVVADEVLHRLSATGAELEVRLEIFATAPDGFSEDVVRMVSENAGTLRLEQSGFEAD